MCCLITVPFYLLRFCLSTIICIKDLLCITICLIGCGLSWLFTRNPFASNTSAETKFLVLAEGNQPITADLIFLHGFGGNRITSWSQDNVCWPRDLLPQDVRNVRIITWGYNSRPSNDAGLYSHAGSFLQDQDTIRQTDEEQSRPLVLVGQSLGALVAKQVLVDSARKTHSGLERGERSVYRLASLTE
ncbi:hypothetical protein MMC13_005256 [Lambiella insularis]|nr:hypothetical protein [Lambiella insularis]